MTWQIKQTALFLDLPDNDIEIILNYCHKIEIEKDELLFRQGEEGSELYLILEGEFATTIAGQNSRNLSISKNAAGDIVGEIALFGKRVHTATCKAQTKGQLLTISKNNLDSLILENPQVSIIFMFRLLDLTTRKLRTSNKFLTDIIEWGEVARKRTITDELTGAYNRRFFDDALPFHFNESKEKGEPFSLVMIDVDYFRDINSCYGESLSDKILVQIVSIIQNNLRKKDMVARYGGDEFFLLLPETNPSEALAISANIGKIIKEIKLEQKVDCPRNEITISMGLASFPAHADNHDLLQKKADAALYQAKRGGRNRVICSEP